MERRTKNWAVVGGVAAVGAGILLIGLTWSSVTPVKPAVDQPPVETRSSPGR